MDTEKDKRLKTFPDMETYVKALEGTRPVRRILIANNGIAAVKFIRSVRSWSYATFNKEKEIEFVAMATPEDLLANAEYIRYSDQVCHVPGGSNVNNYANVNLIVEIAQQYKVDAVWAGWGHASENPRLPNTLDEIGIIFIGPPGGPMYALGDKIGSTIIAQSANVPTIAWNGQDLAVNYAELQEIPAETYEKANVRTVEEAKKQIEKLGVPVMIKASEGGGGKGIRLVDDFSKVEAAFRQVQSEIPGSPIFIMRLSAASRHLEVQLLCDMYGQAIALNGRDCSVQRRHQKILEEGPPIAAKPNVWIEMEKAAVRLAKEVGYVNAGTVEYLYDQNDNFFFLELNPRLQVEHPVTEMITGMNLPSCQLQVAMGIPLHRIPDVRRFYGCDDLYSASRIDFDGQYAEKPTVTAHVKGHTIAARITAENPFAGFQPTSGQISEVNFRSSRNVWGYFSVDSSGRVHEFADSQIGHVFAWGENREEARRNLAMALNDLSIRGEIRTTIEYLKDLIESEDYVANKFDTTWLDARIKRNIAISKVDPVTVILVGAACTAHKHITSLFAEYLTMLERGQLPPATLLRQSYTFDLIYENVKYQLTVDRTGAITYRVNCNNTFVDIELRSLADGGYLVLMGGKSHVAYSKADVGAQRYIIDGQTCLFPDEYDPTQMRALMGGKLLRYLVEDGASVKKGEGYAEVEVMKMNMQLSAQEDGVITLVKPEGSVLEPGDIICTMDLADPSKVQKAELFVDPLPNLGEPWPQALDNMPHQTLERAKVKLVNVVKGYKIAEETIANAMQDVELATRNPLLPALEVEIYISRNKNNLPSTVVSQIEDLCKQFRKTCVSSSSKSVDVSAADSSAAKFAQDVLKALEQSGGSPAADALATLAKQYVGGLALLKVNILGALLEDYIVVEARFADLEMSDNAEKDDVLQELRAAHQNELALVRDMSLAHASRSPRDSLVHRILEAMERTLRFFPQDKKLRARCTELLRDVAGLQGPRNTDVALEARQSLIEIEHSYYEDMQAIEDKLRAHIAGDASARESLITSTSPILTYLMDIIAQPQKFDDELRSAAMQMYIERVYASYSIVSIKNEAEERENNRKVLSSNFVFYSDATDQVQVGSTNPLASVSSFDDLTAVLAQGDLPLDDGANNQSDADESSVGMELDPVDFVKSASTSTLGSNNGNRGLGRSKPFLARQASDYKARAESVEGQSNVVPPFVHRPGMLLFFADKADLLSAFKEKIVQLGAKNKASASPIPLAVIHIILGSPIKDEEGLAENLSSLILGFKDTLQQNGIRRVTFAVVPTKDTTSDEKDSELTKHSILAGHGANFFTFRSSSAFEEDRLVRNIETPLAFQLDLQRLANFNIRLVPIGKGNSKRSKTVHVYEAVPKQGSSNRHVTRYFVRALVRQTERVKLDVSNTFDDYPGPERVFVQALQALESIQEESVGSTRKLGKNHIFMNVLSDSAKISAEYVEGIIRTLHRRYAKRLSAQNVTEFEIRVNAVLAEGAPSIPIRVVASNPTGFALNIDSYVEATDPTDARDSIYYSISEGDGGLGSALAAMGLGASDIATASATQESHSAGSLHGKPLSTPYPTSDEFDERRARAAAAGTTFAFDFPELFRKSLEHEWKSFLERIAPMAPSSPVPPRRTMVDATELILEDEMDSTAEPLSHGLCTTSRAPGRNSLSMVAWKLVLRTPEFPSGRRVVLIANDITVKAGSFGTREDLLFDRASKYARSLGIPRIYIAANSGARVGFAEEVKSAFKVKWVSEKEPAKGYEYLYVEDDVYGQLGPEGRKSLVADKVGDHWKIRAIIGESPDLGVENLRGSGMIAGETARAYEDCFTLTYVSGRNVGIGAYLTRLGQRVIQKGKDAPILLTGYQALNSLMGRDVYTSNLQLGGPKIMYTNGVSHHCVRHDLEGIVKTIHWLSYIPECKGAKLPLRMLSAGDHVDRLVAVHPRDLPNEYDPRLLLEGYTKEDNTWMPGFFDRDSFTECLAGWAKTVITGRARLGKLPVGVITSEIRTVEARAPADPAAPDSQERVWQQAGQVWFPDSSYKTAQAIEDFNKEGLPLFIFSSWRGFSGGQRDMFDQVLKYGSMIVENLVDYKQPVFVYIPPFGSLRGGSHVVVDPTINAEMMEMYCDPDGRDNVLEPPGAVSIKYRKKDLLLTAHRLDDKLLELDEALRSLPQGSDKISDIKAQIKKREELLMPIFHQIAVQFADLHDRPERMLAKQVIREIVPWEKSRRFFYYRLRRRLAEMEACKLIQEATEGSVNSVEFLEELYQKSHSSVPDWTKDEAVLEWLESEEGQQAIKTNLKLLRADVISKSVVALGKEDPKAILRGLMHLINDLRESGRNEDQQFIIENLRKGVIFLSPSAPKP